MTADPWSCLSDTDRAEMDGPGTWARLQRTRHRARYAGIDEPTIRQTEQLAKEKP